MTGPIRSGWRLLAVLAVSSALPFLVASASAASVTVGVTPATGVALKPLAQRQFTATVQGADNTAVTWLVNGVPSGTPAFGFVSAAGVYTAPSYVPAAGTVAVEAQSVAAPLSSGAAAVKLSPTLSSGASYYVSTSGGDATQGSESKPWRTIQHAVSKVPAGATILVASGVYRELVTITRGGSVSAGFTVLRAASGAAPIIDGTGLGIPNGENGLITIANASFVRVQGFEIRNYTSTNAANDPVGILVEGAGSHIALLDNHVHDIKTTVQTDDGDALGIAIYGTSAPAALSDIALDGNELDDLVTGFSESLSLSGNVTGWQVTNNKIHDNNNIGIDAGGYEGFAPQVAYDRARLGYIAGNTVWNITSLHNPAYQGQQSADGIYVDGGTNIVIERNLVHNADLGIEVASEHAGRTSNAVTVRSNIVYHSNVVGISIGGYDSSVGGTSGAVIVNNTLVDNDTTDSGTGEIQIQYHGSNNVFRNNIANATAQGQLIYAYVPTTPAPATLEHDLYDSPAGAANSQFVWQNKDYSGFAAYLAGSKTDQGSRFANPLFVNAAALNYQLATGSPAIGAGMALPLSWSGIYDFAGTARVKGTTIDQGAFEH